MARDEVHAMSVMKSLLHGADVSVPLALRDAHVCLAIGQMFHSRLIVHRSRDSVLSIATVLLVPVQILNRISHPSLPHLPSNLARRAQFRTDFNQLLISTEVDASDVGESVQVDLFVALLSIIVRRCGR